ncbi:MAG: hypothetical protein VYB44_07395 [Bacteroidota bacterium]|nr:hypothetical protein [Bacteroidota bacterium]
MLLDGKPFTQNKTIDLMSQIAKSSTKLEIQKSIETSDLLKCKPVFQQIQEYGFNQVKSIIGISIMKCSDSLSIPLNEKTISILAEDLLDKYSHDAIEDITEAIRKGRTGKYSNDPSTKSYGKLNMEVFSVWMTHHLEEKARAREQQVREEKEKSEQENSGDRLIDIIDFKKNKINQMIADGKPKEEIDKEYTEFMELKEQLKQESFNLKKDLERKKPKSASIQDREQFEISRRKEQLSKWEILVRDSTDSELDDMLPTIKDAEMRGICLEEIKRRTDGRSIRDPKESREAVKS